MKTLSMSFKTLCMSVLALCALSLASCSQVDDLEGKVDGLTERVEALEAAQQKLADDLTAMAENIEGLYTLSFKVDAESAELYYSYDGETWTATGVYVYDKHECVVKEVVDNGDDVTFYFGENSLTIAKAKVIDFEIRSGKLFFVASEVKSVSMKQSGIVDLSILATPKGWNAEVTDMGKLEITAPAVNPDYDPYDWWNTASPVLGAESGYVKVHAAAEDGSCLVGKILCAVSEAGLSVSAYAGNAYFVNNGYQYYYGVSKKADYEADATNMLNAINNNDYNYLDAYQWVGESGEMTVALADVLGAEPEVGVEYVVWAIANDYNGPYTLADMVLSYYQVVEVSAEETAATPYNVDVVVSCVGAEGYIAIAMPAIYDDGMQESNMLENYVGGYIYGKYYTEAYKGSLLDICAGTQYTMGGSYAPEESYSLYVLPLDGRPATAYATTDIKKFTFTTPALAAGGSVNAKVEASNVKLGYDYDIWEYVEMPIDPYTELAVKYEPASTGWVACYATWLDDEELAVYGSNTTALVKAIVSEYYIEPVFATDNKTMPILSHTQVAAGAGSNFVCFFVDEEGKYGEVTKMALKTKAVEYSEATWSVSSNLTADNLLKNTKDLELSFSSSATLSKFKYIRYSVQYYNPYEGMTDEELLNAVLFEDSTTVEASELVNGKLVVSNHAYGTPYVFFIAAYDADGKPLKTLVKYNYTCQFALDNVIGDASKYVGEPTITPHFATTIGEADGPCYYYEDQRDWGMGYYYRYWVSYDVAPAEGTTVTSILVRYDADGYTLPDGVEARAGNVIQGKYGNSYTYTDTVATEHPARQLGNYNTATSAPQVMIAVVWTDANGQYYYKEVDLNAEYTRMFNELNAAVAALQ